MKSLYLVAISIVLFSCSNPQKECVQDVEMVNIEQPAYKVAYSGALKNFMHKGDISAKADMRDFKGIDHWYALGALENLEGEILVLDSKPYNSTAIDGDLYTNNSFEHKASLLVYATVEDWDTLAVPTSVVSYEQLEKFVEESAESNGVDVEKPFPFLLEGEASSLDWHVINWPVGDTIHTHEKHRTSGLHGSLENIDVEILGFYSDSHHTIFTHHTTNMHMHFLSSDQKSTGHVDGLELGIGMKLLLPRSK